MLNYKKYSKYTGLAVLLIMLSFQFFSVMPGTNDDTNICLQKYIDKNIKIFEEELANFDSSKENFVFTNPVYFFKGNKLVFWSHSNYLSPTISTHPADTIYRIVSENEQFFAKGMWFDSNYYLTLIPVVDKDKALLVPTNSFSCLIESPQIKTVSYDKRITFEVDRVKKTNQNMLMIWLFLLAIVYITFTLSPVFNRFIINRIKFLKKFSKPTLFLIFLLSIACLNSFMPFYSGYWFTASVYENSLLPVSPFLIIIASVLSIYLIAEIHKSIQDKILDKNKKNILLKVSLLYALISIAGILMISCIHSLYNASEINFHIEQLFGFRFKEIIYLIIFLLIFSNYFSISQLCYLIIYKFKISYYQKAMGVGPAILFLVIASIGGLIEIKTFPLILSFLIFIILLDLFNDRRSLNSTWIFTWIILIGAYLSFVIFSTDFKNDKLERLEEIEKIIQPRDFELEEVIGSSRTNSSDRYIREKIRIKSDRIDSRKKQHLRINDSLFFSPLSGEYLFIADNKNSSTVNIENYYLNHTKNKEKTYTKIKDHFIIFHDQKVLINRLNGIKHGIPTQLINDPTTNESIKKGYSQLKVDAHSGLSVIHIAKLPGLLRPVSLFSLLFFMLSIILFLLSLANTRIRFLPAHINMRFIAKKSLRNRIQISIISLIIASFIIIGIVTSYYFQSIAKKTDRNLLLSQSENIKYEIENRIKNKSPENIQKELLNYFLEQEEYKGKIHYLYGQNGVLIKDNRRRLGSNSAPLPILPYTVYKKIDIIGDPGVIYYDADELQGSFIPIKIAKKQTLTVFYPGPKHRDIFGSISDILATFLNIYTLLFILSGAIAIALANSITNPIEILGRKLKGLKLSNKNEIVQWKNEDEIGALIAIYNEMIIKLSESARVMAKVERDSAWKEMAKQVAHEIKNPLTPMKLNIQYLETKVRMNPEDATELIEQIAPSLIEQIDNLSQIASEFSNFAQMPSARNEKIKLNEIVKTVHDFFRKREDLDFQLFVPINDVLVFADKNHLVRIMNNVIKNAIQSIPPEREGEIILRLYRQEGNAIVQVTDNGAGIPEDMKDRVFTPNFTTKSSGTGLGLAISTNMLESFNGRIYFDTIENKGTNFYIEIPLMRLEDNYPEGQTRVMLDD